MTKKKTSHLKLVETVDLRLELTISKHNHNTLEAAGKTSKKSPANVLRLILEGGILDRLFADLNTELAERQEGKAMEVARNEITTSVLQAPAVEAAKLPPVVGGWYDPNLDTFEAKPNQQ